MGREASLATEKLCNEAVSVPAGHPHFVDQKHNNGGGYPVPGSIIPQPHVFPGLPNPVAPSSGAVCTCPHGWKPVESQGCGGGYWQQPAPGPYGNSFDSQLNMQGSTFVDQIHNNGGAMGGYKRSGRGGSGKRSGKGGSGKRNGKAGK